MSLRLWNNELEEMRWPSMIAMFAGVSAGNTGLENFLYGEAHFDRYVLTLDGSLAIVEAFWQMHTCSCCLTPGPRIRVCYRPLDGCRSE